MARTPDAPRGEVLRRWFRGLPRTTRRLVVAGVVLGWLAAWYVFLLLVERAFDDAEVSWTEPLSSMIGPLIGIALAFWLRRRAMGGHVWEFDRAVRRRRLPDDADPAEWGPLIEKGERFQRRARTFALAFMVFAVVVVVIGFAWVGSGWVAVLVAAVIGVVGVALLEVASRRQTARIESLRDQLPGLPDRGPLTPGG